MEISKKAKLEIVSTTEGVLDFFVEEGSKIMRAHSVTKKFTPEQLAGCSYDSICFEVDGIETYAVEVEINGEILVVNETLEDFEYGLSELGLLEFNAEVIDFPAQNENDDSSEMVA